MYEVILKNWKVYEFLTITCWSNDIWFELLIVLQKYSKRIQLSCNYSKMYSKTKKVLRFIQKFGGNVKKSYKIYIVY